MLVEGSNELEYKTPTGDYNDTIKLVTAQCFDVSIIIPFRMGSIFLLIKRDWRYEENSAIAFCLLKILYIMRNQVSS